MIVNVQANAGGDLIESHAARRILDGSMTEGRFALIEHHELRGDGPPRHLHHLEDEVMYVLEGQLSISCGEEWIDATTGTCVYLPRGVEHAYRVESDSARMIVIYAPAGLEDSLTGGSWGSRHSGMEHLIAVAARFGVDITGPPLT